MNIYWSKREQGGIEFGIIYGVIALLGLIIARFFPLGSFLPGCTFKFLTGFPCPTCGTTRSLIHLSHARFLPSLAMNPLVFIIMGGLIIAFFYSIVTLLFDLRRVNISLSDAEKDRIRKIAVAIVFLNWLYLVFAL